jgi:hypothetical protein
MVATYLAEESIELLQNQYDSLYVYCKKQSAELLCTPSIVSPEETAGKIAWRVFKERLGPTGGVSCYSADNPYGCSFDYADMTGDITTSPARYLISSVECPYLVKVKKQTPSQYLTEGATAEDFYVYTCKGLTSHIGGGIVTDIPFTRAVTIEQLPVGSAPTLENDDLRVTSKVQFKGYNGLTQTVKIVRFFHSKS